MHVMKQEKIDNNPILVLTFDFALEVMKYCRILDEQKQFHLSRQLFKSGTSIGANAREAQNAESKADFIHKFKISAKEVDETQYWLMLCARAENYPDCAHLLKKLDEIDKVITKIVSTSKK